MTFFIFIMEIIIPGKTVFISRQGPGANESMPLYHDVPHLRQKPHHIHDLS